MSRNVAVVGLIAVLFGMGCGQDPSESENTAAVTGPAALTTDASSYHYGTYVQVTWAGLNGNATDWIALSPAGSPFTSVARWAYTGGGTSGTTTLEGPVPGGSYVARAFDNNTYTLMGESDPFAVADVSDTMATITLDQTSYAIDQDIVASWTGLPADPHDWIGVFPEAQTDDHLAAIWLYTGGAVNGSITFARGVSVTGYTGGNYVARLFLNDTYTQVGETPPFLAGSLVTTDQSSYQTNTPIGVSWQHMPGIAGDWVALAPAGSDPDVITTWLFTGGTVNGGISFGEGLPTTGTFVARTFVPDSYVISGESAPFTVTPGPMATVTTDQTAYALGDPILVTWVGTPGGATDWIALAPAGSPDTTVVSWVYTGGQANGNNLFSGPATPGMYVARAFINDRYIKIGESAPFPVN